MDSNMRMEPTMWWMHITLMSAVPALCLSWQAQHMQCSKYGVR